MEEPKYKETPTNRFCPNDRRHLSTIKLALWLYYCLISQSLVQIFNLADPYDDAVYLRYVDDC